MSEPDSKPSELLEVLKRSAAFRKDWGLLFGAFFFNRAINAAAGRRPLLWSWWIGAGVTAIAAWLRSRGWLSLSLWSGV
jgi:hypothetical protein